jgi:hypothetical protein
MTRRRDFVALLSGGVAAGGAGAAIQMARVGAPYIGTADAEAFKKEQDIQSSARSMKHGHAFLG